MSVELKGVKETLRAIRKIDPELLKEMNKEIKGVMTPMRDKARRYAPPLRRVAFIIGTRVRPVKKSRLKILPFVLLMPPALYDVFHFMMPRQLVRVFFIRRHLVSVIKTVFRLCIS